MFGKRLFSRFQFAVSCFGMGSASYGIHYSSKRTECSPNKANKQDSSNVFETANFLTFEKASEIRSKFGTPVYVYDENTLVSRALQAKAFPHAYGLKVRYAMKASPNAAILRIFNSCGVLLDASSGYEVRRAIKAGIRPENISLSSQEMPADFVELINMGIDFNACSLHQLTEFGKHFPGRSVGVRFNPGSGSGGNSKTNVGGANASFGIWHDSIDTVQTIAEHYQLSICRIHTHIGSGSDPAIWQRVSAMSLAIVEKFPNVTTLNLGGGYKVARSRDESATDLQLIGAPVRDAFVAFRERTGRELKLEIEPGTFLVANGGSILCTVQDVADTTASTEDVGHKFLKLDTGMTELLRPCLYGAQHPVVVHKPPMIKSSDTTGAADFVVVGHCCESGDLITCRPGDSETIRRVSLPASTEIGNLVSIEGAGAYCGSMSAKNYNSFPEAAEVLIDRKGNLHLIRRRQSLDQIIQNEVHYNLGSL